MYFLETVTFYYYINPNYITYNLLYNPICGLLCLLSYWENINSHIKSYNG